MVDTKTYIKEVTKAFSFEQIQQLLNKAGNLSVLVIGDTILDQYTFVRPKGRAIKDPILSVEYEQEETYAGGIIAIANHIATFVKEVNLVTVLGEQGSYETFVKQHLLPNTKVKTFLKPNAPTTVKKRFIDSYRKNKLFKIEYMNDSPLSDELTHQINTYLDQELPKYDLVIVGDFGHGFINDAIRRRLEAGAKFLAVNAQSNSANMGYNHFTHYQRADLITMDEEELRLPVAKRFAKIEDVMKEVFSKYQLQRFLVTQGKKGCTYVKNGKLISAPIMTRDVKDAVGAGDALYSIASLMTYLQVDDRLVAFLGNCAGGIAVNIMGNKESVTKEKLLDFVREIYHHADQVEIDHYFKSVGDSLKGLDKQSVSEFVKALLETYQRGGTIYAFGNGGSGATASHFCGDLIKGVSYGLDKRFKAVCLNDNMPALMAIANDISYDDIFIEQLKNFLHKDDLVVGISGSGNSANVVKALEYSKGSGVKTLAICGFKGGKIKEIADLSIHAEVDDMEITEDIHNLIIIHCVKRVLTKELDNNNLGEKYEQRAQNGVM